MAGDFQRHPEALFLTGQHPGGLPPSDGAPEGLQPCRAPPLPLHTAAWRLLGRLHPLPAPLPSQTLPPWPVRGQAGGGAGFLPGPTAPSSSVNHATSLLHEKPHLSTNAY